jgi:protein TonB
MQRQALLNQTIANLAKTRSDLREAVAANLHTGDEAPRRIGGDIRPPAKLKDVSPVYPPIAASAHVQGAVIIEATIDGSGRITQTKIVRSIPLLDQAAVDAVRQWIFAPTLVDGRAVPVIMTVTVNFTLS